MVATRLNSFLVFKPLVSSVPLKIKSRFLIAASKVLSSGAAFFLGLALEQTSYSAHVSDTNAPRLCFPQGLCASPLFLERTCLRSSLDWFLVTQVSAQMAPPQRPFLSTSPVLAITSTCFIFLKAVIIIKCYLVHLSTVSILTEV